MKLPVGTLAIGSWPRKKTSAKAPLSAMKTSAALAKKTGQETVIDRWYRSIQNPLFNPRVMISRLPILTMLDRGFFEIRRSGCIDLLPARSACSAAASIFPLKILLWRVGWHATASGLRASPSELRPQLRRRGRVWRDRHRLEQGGCVAGRVAPTCRGWAQAPRGAVPVRGSSIRRLALDLPLATAIFGGAALSV